MKPEEVVAKLEETGALLVGHFELSSGLHSDRYIQSALALMHPDDAARLGSAIAALFTDVRVTLVCGPALGGVIIAHEVARALRVPCIFSERKDGEMMIRRGFKIGASDQVLLVEDVVTTGKSVMELAGLVNDAGARIVGYGCIVDRSCGASQLPQPPRALTTMKLTAYEPHSCPLCKQGSKPMKLGSRPGGLA